MVSVVPLWALSHSQSGLSQKWPTGNRVSSQMVHPEPLYLTRYVLFPLILKGFSKVQIRGATTKTQSLCVQLCGATCYNGDYITIMWCYNAYNYAVLCGATTTRSTHTFYTCSLAVELFALMPF